MRRRASSAGSAPAISPCRLESTSSRSNSARRAGSAALATGAASRMKDDSHQDRSVHRSRLQASDSVIPSMCHKIKI